MPFPFLPAGAILAAVVLIGALVAFGWILRAMDRAIVGVRDTAVAGLVAGLRTWSAPGAPLNSHPQAGPPASTDPPADIVDLGTRRIEPPHRSGR